MTNTFALISLGCAKNLVNSEQMLYMMNEAGIELIDDLAAADVVIINTCGFIDSAKQEAIDTIFSTYEVNKNIIVCGCLSERYKDEIVDELPEVRAFLGVGSYNDIVEAAKEVIVGNQFTSFNNDSSHLDDLSRVISTGPSWAYLKIAEGCDNFCAFCYIPFIRGRYRSRPMENVLEEASELAKHGCKEIIVIAQDITKYGSDIYGENKLAELCHEISKIDGIEWIRLHYLYPESVDDKLIDEIASNEKIVKYLDIPIQHINDEILEKMNRHTDGQFIKDLFKKLRKRIPGLVLRTSLISGLPGEGEKEFEELCSFLKEAKIERAGVFPFYPEEGTLAAKMNHCDFDTAKYRADFIMNEIQAPIMDSFCDSFIGKTIKVLTQYYDEENDLTVCRSFADSPDIDGEVCFEGNFPLGEFVNVTIEYFDDGILYGVRTL